MPNKKIKKCDFCEITEDVDGSKLLYPNLDNNEKTFSYASGSYECLCVECKENLDDEFSGISHIITNESESDFTDSFDSK